VSVEPAVSITAAGLADVLLSSRYRLGDVVGSGPAGHVYAAHDVLLDRAVAVKVLDALEEEVGIGRAVRAARTAARARGARLVDVLDVEYGRPAFLVLGLVAARPLPLAAPAGLGVHHAVRVAEDVLSALAALHEVGALHRDVRAENVLLGEDGRAWLTGAGMGEAARDVGLGLRVGADPLPRRAPAPSLEQDLGVPATARSDVAAAGALLGVLLAGRGGPEVEHVLRRATSPDPEARQRDAGDLLDALREALAGPRPRVLRPVAVRPGPSAPSASPAPSTPSGPAAQSGRSGTAAAGAPGEVAGKPAALEDYLLTVPVEPHTPRLAGRLALSAAALTAAWLLVGVPIANLGAAVPPPAVPSGSSALAAPEGPAVVGRDGLVAPASLPPQRLSAVLAAAAAQRDLGPQTEDLLDRLQQLDRLRGIAREAEAAQLYGLAAVDALTAAGSAPISGQVADLLRPEVTLDGLAAVVDLDPAAAGTLGRTFAARVRVLATLEGEPRREEAFALWLLSQQGVADSTLTPAFDAAARAVLEGIVGST